MDKTKKKKKKSSDRARAWKCVRFDDKKGFKTKFYKTHFQNESRMEMYYYCVKCVEQAMRGSSPTSVATKKKFQRFREASVGLNSKLKALHQGLESFTHVEKRETMEKLFDVLVDKLAAAMSCGPVQGVDTEADSPNDMQLGEGSGRDPASEGVANTSRPPDELNQSMSDMECRASRYPDILPEFDWLKQQFILYVNKLKDRETNEHLWLESRSKLLRRSMEEIPSQLPEDILVEDPQNQLSKAAMEDVDFQGSYDPASDFGVKNIETPTPHCEKDGFLRNRSISEVLEVVPSLTGRFRKNIGDIRPEVYNGGSADGDLPSKPIMHVSMEGFSPQASDLQIGDLFSGSDPFVITPNPGGNNILQIVAIDSFVSTEQSADEQEQLPEWQFYMPVEEGWTHLWHSPVRHVSIDSLPA